MKDEEETRQTEENQSRERSYTPADFIEWVRIWLTDTNRPRSDIGILVLTSVIAVSALYSAWVFQRQLAEARGLTILAEGTAKRQFRAYLLYESGSVAVSDDRRSYAVSIEVKNFGQTPAYGATHWFTAKEMNRIPDPFKHFLPPERNPPNEPVRFTTTQKEGASDIGFGQSICIQKKLLVTDLSSHDEVIYVWGDVKYSDQFKRCQFEAFVPPKCGPN